MPGKYDSIAGFPASEAARPFISVKVIMTLKSYIAGREQGDQVHWPGDLVVSCERARGGAGNRRARSRGRLRAHEHQPGGSEHRGSSRGTTSSRPSRPSAERARASVLPKSPRRCLARSGAAPRLPGRRGRPGAGGWRPRRRPGRGWSSGNAGPGALRQARRTGDTGECGQGRWRPRPPARRHKTGGAPRPGTPGPAGQARPWPDGRGLIERGGAQRAGPDRPVGRVEPQRHHGEQDPGRRGP